MVPEALQWVVEHSEAKYSDRLVMFVVAFRLNEVYRVAWPSVGTIARDANISEVVARWTQAQRIPDSLVAEQTTLAAWNDPDHLVGTRMQEEGWRPRRP